MTTLLSLPYLTLYLHPGPAPVLELSWLSYLNSSDFRAAALQALALSRQHNAKAWLGDDRLLGAVRPSDTEWAEQTILAPLSEDGLERFAVMNSQMALNKFILGDMYKRVRPTVSFDIRHFDDLDEARAWALGLASPA